MPVDTFKARKQWDRYQWCRDHGHHKFVEKADTCERFFEGEQWDRATLERLRAQRRPALTINKIISTISNVMGEQIFNRAEISFRPRSGADPQVAEVLSKVFKQISDTQQLDWKRSDMFADGIITSRGFLDIRMAFDDNLKGDIVYDNVNPKNIIIDPDADEFDPDTWNDLFITKWMSADMIEMHYNKADAEYLRNRPSTSFQYGYDSLDFRRDSFGGNETHFIPFGSQYDESGVLRNIRVVERQVREITNQKHFVEYETGDTRPVPDDFDRNRIAWFKEKFGFGVMSKRVQRIKWIVTADDVVLHDEFSPYKHFTIVPFFPYFRHGRTIGLVENLVGPQELLNKVSSQELHVVNTTANSGWKVKKGTLANMSPSELEERGAETGLVVEVNGDPDKDIVKITPNATPTGLDRVSYKAEESIKAISGVSDSQQGMDRADVAAKAIQAKRQASSTNLAKPLDSLTRTDFLIARNTLDLVQQFYTEERIMTITHSQLTNEHEQFTVNQVDPATGEVINDLTIGEYDIVISSVPVRETLEDSQFEQAMSLKEAGVAIPDEVLIENSRLMNKKDIIAKMGAQAQSPQAQQQAAMQQQAQQAELAKMQAETQQKQADAGLKQAKAKKEEVMAQKEAATPVEDNGAQAQVMKTHAEIDLSERKFQHEMSMEERRMQMEQQSHQFEQHLKVQDHQQDAVLKERQAAAQEQATRVAAIQGANNNQPTKERSK